MIVTTKSGKRQGRLGEGTGVFGSVRFTKMADPSTPDLLWPAYDAVRPATMELNEHCRVLDDPYALQREALAGLF